METLGIVSSKESLVTVLGDKGAGQCDPTCRTVGIVCAHVLLFTQIHWRPI